MATTAEPSLDLSTLIPERPRVRIDGTIYHLRSPDELTLVESHQFSVWGKELELLGKDKDRLAELERLMRTVTRAALVDVPAEVFDRLKPSQHVSIVEVFTLLLLGHQARLAGAVASAVRSTGRNSSRASSTPSGASLAGGSTGPRQHSSGPT